MVYCNSYVVLCFNLLALLAVRLCEDKLALIRQVLESTTLAYKKKQKVIYFAISQVSVTRVTYEILTYTMYR